MRGQAREILDRTGTIPSSSVDRTWSDTSGAECPASPATEWTWWDTSGAEGPTSPATEWAWWNTSDAEGLTGYATDWIWWPDGLSAQSDKGIQGSNLRSAGHVVAGLLLPLAAVALAIALVALNAPAALRSLLALPTLALVCGGSLTRLLLGAKFRASEAASFECELDATGKPGGIVGTAQDGLLRLLLSVVLGMLVPLALVLASQAVGLPIEGLSVLAVVGGAALVLLVAAELRRPAVQGITGNGTSRTWLRPALGAGATIATLICAVALAAALPAPTIERYTLLGFTGQQAYSRTSPTATPGSAVIFHVALSSYGQPLAAGVPRTVVTVAGQPSDRLRSSWAAVQASPTRTGGTVPEALERRTGRLVFRAPRLPGLYPVTVLTQEPGGDPLLLTTYLEVTS